MQSIKVNHAKELNTTTFHENKKIGLRKYFREP